MSQCNELVYVEVDIYRPGETEFADALDDWEYDLWVYPTRPDASNVSDVTEDAGDGEPGEEDEECAFTDLAFHIMPITMHNPAFPSPEWKSYIDMLIDESNANLRDVFEVGANEHWLPVIQRLMAEQPTTNRVSFYAVYAVTQTTRKDENGTESAFEFDYAGELDFARLPLVQS